MSYTIGVAHELLLPGGEYSDVQLSGAAYHLFDLLKYGMLKPEGVQDWISQNVCGQSHP